MGFFISHLKIFCSYTIDQERPENLGLCSAYAYAQHLWLLSREGTLSCHTYYNEGTSIYTSNSFSSLNKPVVLRSYSNSAYPNQRDSTLFADQLMTWRSTDLDDQTSFPRSRTDWTVASRWTAEAHWLTTVNKM